MDTSFLRKLLNLPEPKQPGDTLTRPTEATGARTGTDVAGAWSTAAHTEPEGTAGGAAALGESWVEVAQEPRRGRALRRFLRGGAVVVIVLLCFLGVRQMFIGARPPVVTPIPAALSFPAAAATGIAERFAVAYYSWDKATEKARDDEIAHDFAGATTDARYGWNGQGKQTATGAYTVALDVTDDERAAATVTFWVTSYAPKEADKWVVGETYRQTAQIPLAVSNGRVVVSGLPALTAEPVATALPIPPNELVDQDLTPATKASMATFWERYGADDDLSSITAPGSTVAGLGGTVTYEAMTDWRVLTGGDKTRRAFVTVEWITHSGAKIKQHYSLEIIRVSAGGTDRWQVLTVTSNY